MTVRTRKMRFEKIEISLADIEKAELAALARDLVLFFTDKGKTVASAESCTGGLFGATVTGISGASAVYLGGVISYTNEVKEKMLGVARATLEAHTAVSEYTACEMARGVRERLGSDYGVSVTGYAGPTGGDEKNPVGTVFVCVAYSCGETVTRLSFCEGADREQIRKYAVYFMMTQLMSEIGG